jgi:nitrogen fixation/metabolism regulation signal transduction histidine kinase
MASDPAKPLRRRLPLSGSNPRRLSFELRIRVWLAALGVPAVGLATTLTWLADHSPVETIALAAVTALAWALAVSFLYDSIMRPLQTLSNVVAALREDDFSFRARGARRGDSMGDLALEINALAGTLQHQRVSARDALTLAELVMSSMQSPVLAFDAATRLHLLNAAAERTFNLPRSRALNQFAAELNLDALFSTPDQGLFDPQPAQPGIQPGPLNANPSARWSVRRTTFRLHGVPHTLFALADVSAALREEERLAWQRLIRVLGHEINNSLTPIKSIAGSLRTRLSSADETLPDFDRGLSVIENRADSLNRFLQAYQQLFRLPPPKRSAVSIGPIVHQVAQLETRFTVTVDAGPPATVYADPDQLQQLLINLIRNAADSALAAALTSPRTPQVEIGWLIHPRQIVLHILDNGTGLASSANLFVPFYTTKPEGTGIGLILAQQIANAHHGSVTLRNRPGTPGCQADVILPL